MPDTVRIQFELSADKVRELEKLMAEADVPTKKDFINNALTLLVWAMEETRAGRVIASLDQSTENYKELVMPVLSAISSKKRVA
jgi:hypothetical protein